MVDDLLGKADGGEVQTGTLTSTALPEVTAGAWRATSRRSVGTRWRVWNAPREVKSEPRARVRDFEDNGRMARRFHHEGAIWEVALTGPGTIGCSVRRVEVTFTNPATGVAIPGRVSMMGEGRLTDDQLVSALTDALADADAATGQPPA
jgi:hypothetical protein